MVAEHSPPIAFVRWGMLLLATMGLFAPAKAEPGGMDLLSAETLTVAGEVRIVGVDGERSWTENGFGKLRFGRSQSGRPSDFHFDPVFGEANLIWQPRFTWSISGTVVGLVQSGPDLEAGLSEAFLSWKPLADSAVRVSARAGLMWPPLSLEHSGPEWTVTSTITPSAINSWISEEVKVIGGEFSGSARLGEHRFTATAALFDANDTAGALLAFRGWALHDRKIVAGRRQPLPLTSTFVQTIQPPYTHPVLDMDPGFFKRPGYYAKFAWDPPAPMHLEYLHYDNGGDPEAVNADLEWGWRTRFDNIGFVADLSEHWQLRAQGMSGRARMGFPMDGHIWVDTRFRSAFALLTRQFQQGALAARIEVFDTRNRGSAVTAEDNEEGWAVTLAAKRALDDNLTLLVEGLHVESDRLARNRMMLAADQNSNQLQLSLRARW